MGNAEYMGKCCCFWVLSTTRLLLRLTKTKNIKNSSLPLQTPSHRSLSSLFITTPSQVSHTIPFFSFRATKMKYFTLFALATPALVAAHAGCHDYVHGQDLFKRTEQEEEYTRQLKARYPQVNARVKHGLAKRQNRETAPSSAPLRATGTLTRINTAAVAALS